MSTRSPASRPSNTPFSDLRVTLDGGKSIHDLAAQYVVKKFFGWHNRLAPPVVATSTSDQRVSSDPICIIGAGCAGLYAAMILDSLGITDYVILEANDERIGGRLFTHRFNGNAGLNAEIGDPARYDYVDMGAMRYPDTPFMGRVFELFRKRLDINEENGLLIDYIFEDSNTFKLYNGTRARSNAVGAPQADAFLMSEARGGKVPDAFVDLGPARVAADVYRPFAEEFRVNGFEAGWANLTAYDAFTVRGYMLANGSAGVPYPPRVVEWLETFRTGTGLYNLGFVQSTMSALDFGFDPINPNGAGAFPWFCIDGGSDLITAKMEKRINDHQAGRIFRGRRVTAMARALNDDGIVVMRVTSRDNDDHEFVQNYSQVICTVPLGCLAVIDIPTNDLREQQQTAIRALSYGTSTKVALRFPTRWWEDPAVMSGLPIQGGISSTDLPIRTCVYPSYGIGPNMPLANRPGALLASYTWGQDAQRLGGLALGPGTPADAESKELTLKNLIKLHDLPENTFGDVDAIQHFAHNWQNDINARGANAAFGPGQFGNPNDPDNLYVNMKRPAPGGLLYFAGDAVSVHHAWVLGALNSAWRAVFFALGKLPNGAQLRTQLATEPDWNTTNDWNTPNWGIPNEETIADLEALEALAD